MTKNVCDSCLTAIYDEPFGSELNADEQARMAIDMGACVSDHLCDAHEEPELGPCACAWHEWDEE